MYICSTQKQKIVWEHILTEYTSTETFVRLQSGSQRTGLITVFLLSLHKIKL